MKNIFLFFVLFFSFSILAESFCVIGDGGDGSSNQVNVAKALEKETCKYILYTGDVIYEEGIKSSTDKNFTSKFLTPYQKLMDNKVKFYMSMGNHDWSSGASGKYWVEISKKYDYISYPNYWFAKKIGTTCLLSIETNKSSYFSDQQKWWDKFQKDAFWTDCKFTIGFGHVPYYGSGGHGDASSSMKKTLEKLTVGKFDMYVAGHDHNLSDEGDKNGTRLLVSGCAGKKDDLKTKPRVWGMGKVNGYLVIDVNESVASYRFVTVSKDTVKTEHTGSVNGKGLR